MREVLTEKKIRDAKKFPLFGSDTAGRGYRMKRKNTQKFETRRKTRRSENADGSSKVNKKSVGGDHPRLGFPVGTSLFRT